MEAVVGKEVMKSEELEVGSLDVKEPPLGSVDQEVSHWGIVGAETNCKSIRCLGGISHHKGLQQETQMKFSTGTHPSPPTSHPCWTLQQPLCS